MANHCQIQSNKPSQKHIHLLVISVFLHSSLNKGCGRGYLLHIYLIFLNAGETDVFPALFCRKKPALKRVISELYCPLTWFVQLLCSMVHSSGWAPKDVNASVICILQAAYRWNIPAYSSCSCQHPTLWCSTLNMEQISTLLGAGHSRMDEFSL